MSPIDYSKWDKLQVDDPESSAEEDAPPYQVVNNDGPEMVHIEPSRTGSRRLEPSVTRFSQPQSVHIAKGPEAQAHSEPATPPRAIRNAAVSPRDGLGCTPEPSSTPPVREPLAGAVLFDGDLAWDQTSTSVDIYIRLPQTEDRRSSCKGDRKLVLISEQPPESVLGGRTIPAAMTAADPGMVKVEEGGDENDGLFPVAWGLNIKWPVAATCSTPVWRFESDQVGPRPSGITGSSATLAEGAEKKAGTKMFATMKGYFPFPVTNIEESWNWEVIEECPLVEKKEDTRYLHIECVKKQSMSLAGVAIWWDKLFLDHEAIDTSKRPGAEKRAAFAQVWKEAHDAFIEKMRKKKETDDRIVVTSDGCLIDPHNKGPDDDTAKPETS